MTGTKIPHIQFNRENMKRGSKGWVSTMQAIKSAFEEYGCFEASYDEIGPKANDDLRDTIEQLFNLDLETKRRFTSNVLYQGYTLRKDPLYEILSFYDAEAFHTVENFVRVLFPQENGNVQICEIIHSYVTKLWELEKAVRMMVFESFGVEDYFEEQERSMKYAVRMMKYGVGATEESRGKELIPHYDKTFLTILHEYGAKGLEVKTINNNQWIRPTLSGSSFIVIAGELFYGWSNARIHCPLHRVNMSENENSKAIKYSILLASMSNGTVKIPSEMVDEDHPLLFKPFDLMGLIQAFNKDISGPRNFINDEYNVPTLKLHYAI